MSTACSRSTSAAPILVAREALRHHAARAGGSSTSPPNSPISAGPSASVYVRHQGRASSALTRSWARELAPDILVNAVAPGPTDTPLLGFDKLTDGAAGAGDRQSARPHRPAGGGRRGDRLPRRAGRELHHRTMPRRRWRRRDDDEGTTMVDSVFMAELTWPEFEQPRSRPASPVFLPLGATEQHGPHMALNVDVVLPTAVCERVAREVGGIVAPTIPYGYKSQPRSGGGEAFPGTHQPRRQHLRAGRARRDPRASAPTASGGSSWSTAISRTCWPSVEGVDLGLARAAPRRASPTCRCCASNTGTSSGRDDARQALPGRLPGHRARACQPARNLADAAAAARPRRHEARCRHDGPAKFPHLRPLSGAGGFRAGLRRARRRPGLLGREGRAG